MCLDACYNDLGHVRAIWTR